MRYSYVWSNIGWLLMIAGCGMLLPMLVGLYYNESQWSIFGQSALIMLLIGCLLYRLLRPVNGKRRMTLRDSYALITYGWLAVTVFSMIPYLRIGVFDNITDAFFETISGFTTVGASVLTGLEQMPRCVLMWRSVTQWLGGMGILTLFVALIVGQSTSGMSMFKVQTSGLSRSVLKSKVTDMEKLLWKIYMCFTVLIIILYRMAGMNWFDAMNHGFAVVATGGFSTRIQSIGSFQNPEIDWITIFAMFMAGINYSLYCYALRTKSLRCFAKSLELKVYFGITIVATGVVLCIIAPFYDYQLPLTLRYAGLQVVSILTTTGFFTCDFTQWALSAQFVLLLLLLCGACAGSTTGGIKIDRHVILAQKAGQEIRRFLHPRMVTRLKSNNQLVDENVVLSVATFFYLYLFLAAVSTYLVCMMGNDILESILAVLSCLGGVGAAAGSLDAAQFYASMSIPAKWLLSILMLVGRLEIYTVLVLLQPLHATRRSMIDMENDTKLLDELEDNGILEPMVREN